MTSLAQGKVTARDLVGSSSSFASLAAAAAYTASAVIDLGGARKITLGIAYNANAGGTANVLSVIPMVCPQRIGNTPLATDDVWHAPGVWDSTVTAGTVSPGTFPAGTDMTTTPDYARVLYRALDLRTEPADAGTDKIRIAVTLSIEGQRWLHVLYAERGDTTNRGTVWIEYVLHS